MTTSSYPYTIYLITCLANEKRYVGQTRQGLSTRMYEYRREAHVRLDMNRPIADAIRKYGLDSFVFEEIDRADSEEEMDYMECYWIAFYRTANRKYGYNVQTGGQQRPKVKNRMQKGIRCVETGEVFASMAEAARARNISPAALTVHMKGTNKSCNGQHWEWTNNPGATIYNSSDAVKNVFKATSRRQRISNKSTLTSVQCVETEEVFNSMTEAARKYGIDKRSIFSAIERRITAGGVHWVRLTPKREVNSKGTHKKPIKALETGKVYPSLKEAASQNGVDSTTIWCAMRDNTKAAGLHWAYI